MPPKKKGKGPSKAALENEHQAKALVHAYAAAARASLSRPSVDLLRKIEELAEKGKPLEAIALAEPLGVAGTQAICDILASYPKVRNLQLWRCGLGDGGLDAISVFIKASTRPWTRASQLRLLDVAHDGFAPPAAAVVQQVDDAMASDTTYAGGPLLLNDTSPAFTPQALWRLGDALASPLNAAHTAGSIPKGVPVAGTSTLKVLKLDRCYVGDEGCLSLTRGIAACASVAVLSLTYNNLGPKSARAISGLMKEKPPPRLPADPNDARFLAEHEARQETGTAGGDEAAEEEEMWAPYPGGGADGSGGRDWAVCRLAELYVGNNPLGTEGVSHLSEGLAHSRCLKVLSMQRVGLGDDGVAMEVLVKGMERNESLTHLDLSHNLIGDSAGMLIPVLTVKTGGENACAESCREHSEHRTVKKWPRTCVWFWTCTKLCFGDMCVPLASLRLGIKQCRVSERIQRVVAKAIKEILVKRNSKKKGKKGGKKGGKKR